MRRYPKYYTNLGLGFVLENNKIRRTSWQIWIGYPFTTMAKRKYGLRFVGWPWDKLEKWRLQFYWGTLRKEWSHADFINR